MSKSTLSLFFNPSIVRRALIVAAIAGTLLIIVNQWQALLGRVPIDWTKLALTYCVPYLVSSISSYLSARAHQK
jgi:hypothetical protein